MYLHEEVLLLALRDDTGKIEWKAGNFKTAMASAVVAELLLSNRISMSSDKKKLVTLTGNALHEDAVLGGALEMIASSEQSRSILYWIEKLATMKDLKENAAASLCRQGILDAEEGKFFLIFDTISFPEKDAEPERQLIQRLKQAIFSDDQEVDTRTTTLISLTHATGLLAIPFASAELKERKQRIAAITSGDLIGAATSEVLQAAQAALMAAAIIPTIVVTPSDSSGSSGSSGS